MQDELATKLPPDTKATEVKEFLEGLNAESTSKIGGTDEITNEWHLDAAMTLSLEHNDPQTVEKLDTLLIERSMAVATAEGSSRAQHEDRVEKEKTAKKEVEHALEVRKHKPAAKDEVRKREQERMHEIRNGRP
ncbi:hypothetical protein PFICI_00393 [Pestalotiopsis fici W106-1]|uniref:Uncharacterized protein n=1 Tax=Pestalotiopsis fici (strain W106-1 / CGMCC3.15140) TaxID=1229662 RepID=W3XKN6_PESFW|nr:uncharacterized protein PFICI_00393 [Pestalotiopsis fici W106-1]ETS86565.1 hypothetical protein PFICI_00393 [Pestalotiopsis fici W106-1]